MKNTCSRCSPIRLNTDYDRIHELANNHNTIRQMLGHSDWCDDTQYSLQTIKDNLMLFIPEILDQINQEVIKAGHTLVKKSKKMGQQEKRLTQFNQIKNSRRSILSKTLLTDEAKYPVIHVGDQPQK